MFLDLDPGVVEIADARDCTDGSPAVQKIEVNYTYNIEEVLSQLSSPLDVTHTVRPEEVFKNMEAWKPAILKEVKGIEVAIEKLAPGTEARRRWLSNPRVQKLPMKFVFTVKPNDKARLDDVNTWFKRKARLVICGNMATDEGHQVYTETAPAEAVRITLGMASKYKWYVAILDVVAAFLKNTTRSLTYRPSGCGSTSTTIRNNGDLSEDGALGPNKGLIRSQRGPHVVG